MRNITTLLLIISPFFLMSQVSDSIKPKKIDVGITFSPDYCFRRLKTDVDNRSVADMLDTVECSKYGFTTGLNLVYNASQKLSFSAGFLFSDKGERIKNGTIPTVERYKNHYYYLDVPVKINYNLTTKKTVFYVTAGLSSNVFLVASSTYYIENSVDKMKEKNEFEFSKMNFAMNVGLGVNCPLSERCYFKTELLYRESITSLVDTPIKRYLFSFGANFGFYYHL